MYECHVENCYVSKKMLEPELIIAEACRTCIVNYCRGYKCEDGAGEYPEIADGFNFALIPTQYFITKDGEIYKTHTGILSKEDAINILKEMGMAK